MQDGTLLAAIDLGSNSFRLEIGRLEHGQVHRVEYLKETVRQGGGLDADRNLGADAMERGWACLARFAERLAGFEPHQVRAVATQTLREARNRHAFLQRAQELLGFPIEVISGREEARLIYQGVAHHLPQSGERRLVVDIGGRSTELILGTQFDATAMESLRVGSVAWAMEHFPDGQFTAAALRQAEVAAQAVLEEALALCPAGSWDVAYGASGTIGAVGEVLAAAGLPPGVVGLDGLDWLREELLLARSADRVRLAGLKEDRRPVIGGGLSVLRAVFDVFGIRTMQVASGALRHGVLYDLLGREQGERDVRAATVARLATRFATDAAQGERVGRVAAALWRQLHAGEPVPDPGRLERELAWAAQLHEIGSLVAHDGAHKHGAYILEHADAPGFAQQELHRLGSLVLGQRGKLRKLDAALHDGAFAGQLLALRLAVLLCHARREPRLQGLLLRAEPPGATLVLAADWTRAHPQSTHLLLEEAAAWARTRRALRIVVEG